MQYTVEHNEADGICVVKVSGEHKRPEDSKTLQLLARDFRSNTGCVRFLFDMRLADIKGGITETFETGITPARESFAKDFRIALVYKGDMAEHKFMENVVVNRGYQLSVFEEMGSALNWLMQ